MKYIYQIINVPWFNSTVDVWAEKTPEVKHRLRVLGFQKPGGCSEACLCAKMISSGIISSEEGITFERLES